ncbi:hypothetical protein IAR55_000327 [Kwoniella newhampshirensis]|uniref:Uncharacterized protein n=1 Tax=Kwoniella newhampshirensis TaxID=1651941 RepID=A0AAW0Z710_9TREE
MPVPDSMKIKQNQISRWVASCSYSHAHLDACPGLLTQVDPEDEVELTIRQRHQHLSAFGLTTPQSIPPPVSDASGPSSPRRGAARPTHQRHRRSQSVSQIDTSALLPPGLTSTIKETFTPAKPVVDSKKRTRACSFPVRFAEEKNRIHVYDSVTVEDESANDTPRDLPVDENDAEFSVKLETDEQVNATPVHPVTTFAWTLAATSSIGADDGSIPIALSPHLRPRGSTPSFNSTDVDTNDTKIPFTDRLLLKGNHSYLGLSLDHQSLADRRLDFSSFSSSSSSSSNGDSSAPTGQFSPLGFLMTALPGPVEARITLPLLPSPTIVNQGGSDVSPLELLCEHDLAESRAGSGSRSGSKSEVIRRSSSFSLSKFTSDHTRTWSTSPLFLPLDKHDFYLSSHTRSSSSSSSSPSSSSSSKTMICPILVRKRDIIKKSGHEFCEHVHKVFTPLAPDRVLPSTAHVHRKIQNTLSV